MKRFARITDEMALLRETHRYVLSWTHLEEGQAIAFTIHLGKGDLQSLRAALAARQSAETPAIDWSNERGDLRIQKHGEGLMLDFAPLDAGDEPKQLELDSTAARRLQDALDDQR